MSAFANATLSTPQARRGPSSRILQRRSLLVRQEPQEPSSADLTSASVLLGPADLEVTKPPTAYAYQPAEDVTGE